MDTPKKEKDYAWLAVAIVLLISAMPSIMKILSINI